MDVVETSAALGKSVLVLTVAIVLRPPPVPPGQTQLRPGDEHRGAAILVLARHLIGLMWNV